MENNHVNKIYDGYNNIYHDGKIYKLVCGDLSYYGSTTQPLLKRLYLHKKSYESWVRNQKKSLSSFELFKIGNPDIVLVETVACTTKEELHARERFHIENNKCVNKNVPTRTLIEYLKQPYKCKCGCEIKLASKYKHETTQKHKEMMIEKHV